MTKTKAYIDDRLELRWIPEIDGRGVFTQKDIPAGTIIEKAPLIIYPRKLMELAIFLLQAEGYRSHEFVIDRYALEVGSDSAAIPLGWAAIYNHSDNYNCRFATLPEEDLISIIAIRDIPADTQCCVTYGENWFTQKGYIKKVDF